jgi:predicted nuclease of predicted toxin-antitoxin system
VKLIVDAQLPVSLCRWLEARGHQAVHSTRLISPEADDRRIALHAMTTGSYVVTKDYDFVRLQPAIGHAILWLRCGNMTKPALFAWLDLNWHLAEAGFAAGDQTIVLR